MRGALGASRARVVRQLLDRERGACGDGARARSRAGLLGVRVSRTARSARHDAVRAAGARRPHARVGGADRRGHRHAVRPRAGAADDAGGVARPLKSGGRTTRGDKGRRTPRRGAGRDDARPSGGDGAVAGDVLSDALRDLGLRPERVLTLRTALPLDRYADARSPRRLLRRVLDRLAQEPGVEAAGFTTSVPLEWKGGTSVFAIEGRPPRPGARLRREPSASQRRLPADDRRPAAAGHASFVAADDERAQLVVIVNEALARRFWSGENRPSAGASPSIPAAGTAVAHGRRCGRRRSSDGPRRAGPRRKSIFRIGRFDTQPWFTPAISRCGPPAIRRAPSTRSSSSPRDRSGARRSPTSAPSTMSWTRKWRPGASARRSLISFAQRLPWCWRSSVIYGVIAYFVVQHVPEIGVRIALGAQPSDILRFVITRGMSLALAGVAIGTLAATRAAAADDEPVVRRHRRAPSLAWPPACFFWHCRSSPAISPRVVPLASILWRRCVRSDLRLPADARGQACRGQ